MLLTFDDGPSEWTIPIVRLLVEFGAVGVFFVVGENVAGREHVVETLVASGQTIGNHGWTHRRLTDLDDAEVDRELRRTNYLLEGGFGIELSTWRAPFFDHDGRVDYLAAGLGLGEHMGADVIPDDWNVNRPDVIVERVEDGLARGNGEVVCLHDGIPPRGSTSIKTKDRLATVEAVRMLLEARP